MYCVAAGPRAIFPSTCLHTYVHTRTYTQNQAEPGQTRPVLMWHLPRLCLRKLAGTNIALLNEGEYLQIMYYYMRGIAVLQMHVLFNVGLPPFSVFKWWELPPTDILLKQGITTDYCVLLKMSDTTISNHCMIKCDAYLQLLYD